MKKIIHFLLTVVVLAGLGYVLRMGLQNQEDKAADAKEEESAKAAEAAEDKPEDFTVMLDKKRANVLGIEKEQPTKTMLQARRAAFGSVLDPAPLIALDGELATAEAALKASKAENERTQALVATNDASKKTADASEAAFVADRIKLETLVRSAQLQWGSVIDADPVKRRAFIDELVSGTTALIHVDLMPGDALAELPKAATVLVMGRETQPIKITDLRPATSADAKSQAQGFILRADKPPFALRPGMALTAWLELPEKPRAGFAIPRGAVLRHDGRTWVYVQEEEEKYVRKPIKLDAPLDGDEGWFITEDTGLTEDDVIVVVGASSVLSEELKAQGGEPE